MDLPWGTATAIVALWLVGLVAYSVAVALLVARASGRPWWWALGVGVLLPVAGPWIWGVVEYAALKRNGYSSRGRALAIRPTGAAVAWWIGGAVFSLAVFFPWLRLTATVDDYGGRLDPTPLDTTVGAVVLAATAATVVVAGVVVGTAMPRRLAVVIGATGTLWALVCVSSLIVYGTVGEVASDAVLWSGHQFEGEVHPGVALWLATAASVVLIAGAVSAAVTPVVPVVRVPPLPSPEYDAGAFGASRESTGGW